MCAATKLYVDIPKEEIVDLVLYAYDKGIRLHMIGEVDVKNKWGGAMLCEKKIMSVFYVQPVIDGREACWCFTEGDIQRDLLRESFRSVLEYASSMYESFLITDDTLHDGEDCETMPACEVPLPGGGLATRINIEG